MIRSLQAAAPQTGLSLGTALALTSGLLAVTAFASAPADDDEEGGPVAIQAGTIHTVDNGTVFTGGATILIEDGKIVAIGKDVDIPAGARVVDYGSGASIVPGLVAADSSYVPNQSAARTAAPTLRAVDHFDPYSTYYAALTGGVTTAYLAPARNRLVAGQGAVVKMAGEANGDRVLNDSAAIHGSIGREARNTPGYWVPPLPATVDVGLGVALRQLPRTTMGAVVALRELLALQAGDTALESEYGQEAGPALAALIQAGVPWRMGADDAGEVGALIELFQGANQDLVLHASGFAAEHAKDLAAAKISVIYTPAASGTSDTGKGPDVPDPMHDGATLLSNAGVTLAVSAPRAWGPGRLFLAAGFARRGGMSAEAALEAITLTPAKLMGVDARVGSLAVGKDADLCVLGGAPFETGTGVTATWVDGEIAWKTSDAAPTIISVQDLYLGDGHVLSPGEILLEGGKVREVGRRVGRPAGATVITGQAAMPGVIDVLGRLGLNGSRKSISARTDLTRIVEPGDATDRRVARAGVTTVNLSSYSLGQGAKTMAYKPAGDDVREMIIDPTSAIVMQWSNPILSAAGDTVRSQLTNGAKYVQKWADYEKAIAAWTPPAPKEPKDEEPEEEEEEEEEEEKKKKKKSKKKPESIAITGQWEATIGEDDDATHVRMRLREDADGGLEGYARVSSLTELINLTGTRSDYTVELDGLTETGPVRLRFEQDFVEKDVEQPQLIGEVFATDGTFEMTFDRTGTDYPEVRRPERRKAADAPKSPKGMPRLPATNPDLEPIRRAMRGECAIMVIVNNLREVPDCTAAFAKYGIKPVLVYSGSGSFKGADAWADGVSGVILRGNPNLTRNGIPLGNSYAQLAVYGIPVAFQSQAEEGAAGLIDVVTTYVADGLSASAGLAGLTSDAAKILAIDDRVGTLTAGMDGDVVLLDGSPLAPATRVLRVWIDGEEVLP
jgi:imidazolonepropionase-like amidohydrolase